MSANKLMKCLLYKNHDAPELSKANCHEKHSHSK